MRTEKSTMQVVEQEVEDNPYEVSRSVVESSVVLHSQVKSSEVQPFSEEGKIEVVIQGMTPLLMSRLDPEVLKQKTIKRLMNPDFEQEAKASAYLFINEKGKEELYIPSEAVFRCILNASKMRRTGRIPLSSLLAGSIRIEPYKIGLGTDKYELDIRSVVIQKSKILKARAKINEWQVKFYIIYNKGFLGNIIEVLESVIAEAGLRFGLLSYRPQKSGSFGVFRLKSFKVIV